MKIKIDAIKISDIIHCFKNKMYEVTEFQRNPDAWSNKNKELFIKSVLQKFYIPPLLFSNSKILDGLQRISCLNDFINENKFKVSVDNSSDTKYFWTELNQNIKNEISNYQLYIVNVLNDDGRELSDDEQKELFIRINENSIKLNTAEKFFAKCNLKIRQMINEISQNLNLSFIAHFKKGKRFSIEMILIWCLTITYYRSNWFLKPNSKTSVRALTERFGSEEFEQSDISDIIKRSNKTIDLIYEILGDTIIPGKFKVIFTSIFIPFYENIESCNSFLDHKNELRENLTTLYDEFVKKQQIGGIHYDSYRFINESIEKVEYVLIKYLNDNKRIFSRKDKDEIYLKNLSKNKGQIRCSNCGKILTGSEIQYDHINPYTFGGKTSIENGQILCKECNQKLGSKNKISHKIVDLVQKIDDLYHFNELKKQFTIKKPGKIFSKICYIREQNILSYDEITFLRNLFSQRNMICHPDENSKYFPFGKNVDELENSDFQIYENILAKIKRKIDS